MKYVKRSKGMVYESNPSGVRELGTSFVATKAALGAARDVAAAANAIDSKGGYDTKGITTPAGHQLEPRHAAVVEGSWWPGAGSAALVRAVEAVQKKGKPEG